MRKFSPGSRSRNSALSKVEPSSVWSRTRQPAKPVINPRAEMSRAEIAEGKAARKFPDVNRANLRFQRMWQLSAESPRACTRPRVHVPRIGGRRAHARLGLSARDYVPAYGRRYLRGRLWRRLLRNGVNRGEVAAHPTSGRKSDARTIGLSSLEKIKSLKLNPRRPWGRDTVARMKLSGRCVARSTIGWRWTIRFTEIWRGCLWSARRESRKKSNLAERARSNPFTIFSILGDKPCGVASLSKDRTASLSCALISSRSSLLSCFSPLIPAVSMALA